MTGRRDDCDWIRTLAQITIYYIHCSAIVCDGHLIYHDVWDGMMIRLESSSDDSTKLMVMVKQLHDGRDY